MKKILIIATGVVLLAAGVFIVKTFCPCSNSCSAKKEAPAENVAFHGNEDEAGNSVLRLKVEQVIGSEKKSDKLKEAMMKVNGVQKVSACTHSGTVSISYDKNVTADVATLTSAVEKAGFKYEMMGGSCCKSKGKSAAKSCEPKSCDGKKDKQI